MKDSNGKKQTAILWILGILVIILIAIIVGLFIKQAKIKKQEVLANNKTTQMKQELTQVKNETKQSEKSVNDIANSIKTDDKINIVGEWKAVKAIDENGISNSGSSSNFKLKRVYGIY